MSRTRIGILVPNLEGGGAQRVAITLAGALIRRGHEVDLLLKQLACDYPEAELAGARLLYLVPPR